jgi:hypothetical protein
VLISIRYTNWQAGSKHGGQSGTDSKICHQQCDEWRGQED